MTQEMWDKKSMGGGKGGENQNQCTYHISFLNLFYIKKKTHTHEPFCDADQASVIEHRTEH